MGIIFGNDTVTVFNRFFDTLTEEELWFPTLLSNVNIISTEGANITKTGLKETDTAKLFIDVSGNEKQYCEPKAWALLTADEKKEAFTFQKDEDFFVKGNLTEVDILDENFFEWVINHYDYAYKVTTVDEYMDVMPHLEVGGK